MRKRVFNILFIATFAVMLGLGIIGPLLPIYATKLGATGIWLGMIFSGFSLSRFIFMPIIGKISDRKGRKSFITVGLFSFTVISILYVFANNAPTLVLIRMLHGFFSAMVIPIAMAYVGETAEEGHEGRAMGTFNIAMFLGMGSGPLLGGILNDLFGLNSVFFAMAALTSIAFLITFFFLPHSKHLEIRKTDPVPMRQIIKSDIMKALMIFRAINALSRGMIMSFFPLIASHNSLSTTQIGILISANVFLTAVLQRAFGHLADHHNKIVLILIGSVITAIALGIIPLAHGFAGLFVLGISIGLAGAISMPAATAVNVIIGQRMGGMGAVMGLFNSAMSIGMIVGPLLSGIFMQFWGLNWVFYIAGGISLVASFVFLLLVRKTMFEPDFALPAKHEEEYDFIVE